MTAVAFPAPLKKKIKTKQNSSSIPPFSPLTASGNYQSEISVSMTFFFKSISLFISMKFSEVVTYPGFAGVSLCGHVPMYSVCAQWL